MDQFSGTFELFMVVFSRLSHDDYPDWIGATGIAKLGTISGKPWALSTYRKYLMD
jgi:hypothetical protein